VLQAPLGVRSAKRRHQSPEWTILSHSYRLIQGEIVWSQVLLDSLDMMLHEKNEALPVKISGENMQNLGAILHNF